MSLTEAVLLAAAEGMRNALYLKNTNTEIFKTKLELTLHEDNHSCINWLQNAAGYHAKTQHIDKCYHYSRKLYEGKLLNVIYVPSHKQIADILMKPLTGTKR